MCVVDLGLNYLQTPSYTLFCVSNCQFPLYLSRRFTLVAAVTFAFLSPEFFLASAATHRPMPLLGKDYLDGEQHFLSFRASDIMLFGNNVIRCLVVSSISVDQYLMNHLLHLFHSILVVIFNFLMKGSDDYILQRKRSPGVSKRSSLRCWWAKSMFCFLFLIDSTYYCFWSMLGYSE